MGVRDWFHVSFDDEWVHLRVEPPGGEPWTAEVAWTSIERIAFKAEDLGLSDGIYLFTRQRPESYVIPIEGDGGSALWDEILRRGLFDAELAIEAAFLSEGLFVWPPID